MKEIHLKFRMDDPEQRMAWERLSLAHARERISYVELITNLINKTKPPDACPLAPGECETVNRCMNKLIERIGQTTWNAEKPDSAGETMNEEEIDWDFLGG